MSDVPRAENSMLLIASLVLCDWVFVSVVYALAALVDPKELSVTSAPKLGMIGYPKESILQALIL